MEAFTMADFTVLKNSFEKGYGLSIGVVNPTTNDYVAGATVTSTASQRRAIAVAFEASIDNSQVDVAATTAAATAMSSTDLVRNTRHAAVSSGVNPASIPDASTMTVSQPEVTTSNPGSASTGASLPVGMVLGIAGGMAVVLVVAILWVRFRSAVDPSSKLDGPAAKVDGQPGVQSQVPMVPLEGLEDKEVQV